MNIDLIDYFAIRILQSPMNPNWNSPENAVKRAYAIAELMVAESNSRKEPAPKKGKANGPAKSD